MKFPLFFAAATLAALTTSVATAATVSLGAGTAVGGVNLIIDGQSVNMRTTAIELGTGTAGANHLQTGAGTSLGGTFDGTYFDEANFAGGPASDATRMNIADASKVLNGEATDFANAIGFRVTFSQAIKLDHFYIVDIDGADANVGEWATSFALNGAQVITPTLSTASPTNVILLEDEAIAPSWSTELGIAAPTTLDIARITRSIYTGAGPGGALPGEADHQLLVDFRGQTVTSFYMLMGGVSSQGSGGQNSGVSALSFDDTELGAAPVPLPAGIWLLIGGLLSLRLWRGKS